MPDIPEPPMPTKWTLWIRRIRLIMPPFLPLARGKSRLFDAGNPDMKGHGLSLHVAATQLVTATTRGAGPQGAGASIHAPERSWRRPLLSSGGRWRSGGHRPHPDTERTAPEHRPRRVRRQ